MNPRLSRNAKTCILAGALALAACTAIQREEAADTEQVLAAAGFQMKLADTPEKLAHLQTLTQDQLVPHERDGRVYYVYADAAGCQCLYVGTEEQYQRYQQLALREQIAEDRRAAAEMNMDASMDWGTWGPWGPWY